MDLIKGIHLELESPKPEKKGGCLKIGLIVLGAACLTSVLTIVLAKIFLFPTAFKPVELSTREEQVLNTKIDAISSVAPQKTRRPRKTGTAKRSGKNQSETLTPEPYSEANASREIHLTERELNGLLAKNTDLARKLAIDLSDDLASAKLLVPLDPEFPFLGGKTLKVTAGMELRYADQRPVVILRGVSIWGVPIPNAWLGGIKNIDLVREFGMNHGFWHAFAAGVEDIRIEEGQLTVKLKP